MSDVSRSGPEAPAEDATEPVGFAARPDYRIDLRRVRNRLTVTAGDSVLAETTRPLLVDEQDHGLVFYVPSADVRQDLLLAAPEVSTRCPFKGRAAYWRLAADPSGDVVAWEYPQPLPEVGLIRDHIAFYQDRVTVALGVATPAVSGR